MGGTVGAGRSRLRSRVHCNARPVGWFLEPTRNFSRPGVSEAKQFQAFKSSWHFTSVRFDASTRSQAEARDMPDRSQSDRLFR
jgi:hypothetical protein